MNDFERIFSLVIKFLKHRRLRSVLTTLGIAVGVALVFSLMSINVGLQEYISDSMEGFGTNLIMVVPKAMLNPMSGLVPPFDEKDVDALDKLYFVKDAVGLSVATFRIEIKNDEFYKSVYGTESGMTTFFSDLKAFQIEKGRDFTSSDRGKVVLGYAIADTYHLSPGSQIEIEGEKFRVVGIFNELGNNDDDNNIMINIEDLWRLSKKENEYNLIYLGVSEPKTKEIKKALEKTRDAEDFEVFTAESMMEQVNKILVIINAVFLSLASISLLVGSVGVANTMYMAVTERTKDIGIMKAVGASSNTILLIFVLESGFLSLLGGILGILLGVGLAELFALAAAIGAGLTTLEPGFSVGMFISAMILAFLIGIVSGFLPAKQASKLQPVDAFHHG